MPSLFCNCHIAVRRPLTSLNQNHIDHSYFKSNASSAQHSRDCSIYEIQSSHCSPNNDLQDSSIVQYTETRQTNSPSALVETGNNSIIK